MSWSKRAEGLSDRGIHSLPSKKQLVAKAQAEAVAKAEAQAKAVAKAAEQLKKLSVFQESCTKVNNKPIIIHFSSSSSKKLVGPYKLENVKNKTWSIQIQRLSTKVKYIIYADDNYCWWLVRLSGIVHSEFSLGQKITENMILNSYYM